MTDSIVWFEQLSRTDTAVAGGKGANLGELTRAGLPVPPGFVLTPAAMHHALEAGGSTAELSALFDALKPDDPAALAAGACANVKSPTRVLRTSRRPRRGRSARSSS